MKHRMAVRSTVYWAATAVAIMIISPALAMPMVQNYNADFSSPTQAIWGPGQSAADFSYDHYLLGNSSFGLRFATGASTGTVSSNYNGSIAVSYDNAATPGSVPLAISYSGDPGGGHFQTSLGAFVDVTAHVPVFGGLTVTNPNYSLTTSNTYTPSPPDSPSGSGSFTPASSAVGVPDVGVGEADAGIDYDIVEKSTHTISALNGTVIAENESSGDMRTAPFSLAASDNILLNLDETGIWDVQLSSLSLDNLFSTTFSLAAKPFVQYYLGLGCGDLGTDSDNGPFCAGDGRLDTTLVSFPFFSNTAFGLALTSSDILPAFQIDVASSSASSVPEPGTLALLGLALVGLVTVGGGRSSSSESRTSVFRR